MKRFVIEHSETQHFSPDPTGTDAQPNSRRTMLASIGGLAAGAMLAGGRPAHAGPLTPPSGPIHSTPGPEPRIAVNSQNTPGSAGNVFRILQPGSYYLESDVIGESGKNGIAIAADGVTLDLNGFSLRGVPGSSRGIYVFNTPSRVTIRNGNVSGWGQEGINLDNGSVPYSTIVDVISANNAGHGILTSFNSIVDRCVAVENGADGISTGTSCRVTDCYVSSNEGSGIAVRQSGVVERCMSRDNAVHGIRASFWCHVQNCFCRSNGTGGGGTNGAGIRVAGFGNQILSNNCNDNGRGIEVTSSSSFIAGNTCKSNALNWSVQVNNRCYIVSVPSSGTINGDSGGSPTGTSDPMANFTV